MSTRCIQILSMQKLETAANGMPLRASPYKQKQVSSAFSAIFPVKSAFRHGTLVGNGATLLLFDRMLKRRDGGDQRSPDPKRSPCSLSLSLRQHFGHQLLLRCCRRWYRHWRQCYHVMWRKLIPPPLKQTPFSATFCDGDGNPSRRQQTVRGAAIINATDEEDGW
ncbi:hypothetical protein OPV22_012896 [Ensete ventricosum]|uniref:Uncharacterized protein n=1 Tax=Ensete ventricosum TaxID=4639 RepID=A0AAV8QY46_ENSVE|nr:hypothetical protein OPV22_012896 [Ensete ventricosum]